MAEPIRTTTMVMRIVANLPKMSEIWAQKGRNAAEVRLKAEMIQLSCLTWSTG